MRARLVGFAGEDRRRGRRQEQAAPDRDDPSAAPPSAPRAGPSDARLTRSRARRGVDLWILGEDGELELPELASRLDAELLDQRPPGIAIARERVRLAA